MPAEAELAGEGISVNTGTGWLWAMGIALKIYALSVFQLEFSFSHLINTSPGSSFHCVCL
jgi:hypothetical protein